MRLGVGFCDRMTVGLLLFFFFSSRRRHTRFDCDWSSDVCSSDLSQTTATLPEIGSIEPNQHGYRTFTLGSFGFSRDEYFAHVVWPKGRHMLPVDRKSVV